MSTIQDTDFFIVNRGGTDYKITAKDVKEHFKIIPPVPTFVTANVGSDSSNWSPYVTLQNYNTKDPYDPNLIFYHDGEQEADFLFDNIDSNVYRWASREYCELEFKPPVGIQVYDSFAFYGGFAEQSQTGTITINGVDVEDFTASANNPKLFEVDFSGTLDSFSIRQRDPHNDSGIAWSGGISKIVLDGKKLLNQTATTLTFEAGEFFDLIKVGTQLQQVNPEVTGVVSKIEPGNKVVLDDLYSEFVTGSTIIIVGADPI